MKNVIEICGDIFYLENGKLHREDGPSIEYFSGVKWWVQNGKLHKENGKAIEDKNEYVVYWVNGKPATDDEIKNIKRNKWIDDIL